MPDSARSLGPQLLVVLAAACSPSGTDGADQLLLGPRVGTVIPEPVFRDFYTALPAQQTVVGDPAAWRALWDGVTWGVSPEPPLPAVDFSRDLVLVAAMGRRPTGGYAVTIDSVYRHERGTAAYVTETEPGTGCITTQALTAPAVGVTVPKEVAPIQFVVRRAVHDC
ncbi:MAG TPA: protease complex subunit PrcB family protein [Gemmatimonadales bacterium]|jgi:hypothetical protein|nr:protease complex subunit PrcB family protein [Gemmatimonadales bacterium]